MIDKWGRKPAEDSLEGEMQLLQCLQRHLPEASREELASLLNLRIEPSKKSTTAARQNRIGSDRQVIFSAVAEMAGKPDYPPPTKEHPFPLLYARSAKGLPEKNGEPSQAYHDAAPFQKVVQSPMGEEILPDELTPWEEIWPWLHRLFRDQKKTNRLDLERIIGKAVKRQPLSAIPWQQRLRWPHEIVLVVDFSRHLCPFFADYLRLVEKLTSWFKDRLKLIICKDSERQIFIHAGRRYELFPLCEENQYILYLGDLGFLDRQGVSPWRWLSLGRELAGRNARIEALLTVQPEDWRRQHLEFFNLHHWDAGSLFSRDHWGLQKKRTEGDGRSSRQTEDVLACLSLAFELTPALVRRVRKHLGFSVSVEGLIFQHSALRGKFYSFQWRSQELRERYKDRLAQLSHDEDKLWAIIKDFEQRLPPELQVEQRQKAARPLLPHQHQFILNLTKSLHLNTLDAGERESYLAWIGRMAERAGDEIWGDAANNLFGLFHYLKKPPFLPSGVDLERVPESLVRRGRARRRIAVLQQRNELVFTNDIKVFSPGQILAGFTADSRATVQLLSPSGGIKKLLSVGSDLLLPDNITEAVISTASETLTLRFLPCPGWASGIGRDRYGLFTEVQVQGVAFVMRWIPPGSFMMGSPPNEPERSDDEGPQHQVRFAKGFWLAETACTQALWRAVMGDNPSRFQDNPEQPVENVSWQMAMDFIDRINGRKTDLALRLPSEAEWEYACRAGTITPFSFGAKLTAVDANYGVEFPYNKGKKKKPINRTMPVKSFLPNPWGLYQMQGNAWEWCRDRWHDNYRGKPLLDGSIPWSDGDSQEQVCRGGSWFNDGRYLRSACRNNWIFDNVLSGLRLARGPDQQG